MTDPTSDETLAWRVTALVNCLAEAQMEINRLRGVVRQLSQGPCITGLKSNQCICPSCTARAALEVRHD